MFRFVLFCKFVNAHESLINKLKYIKYIKNSKNTTKKLKNIIFVKLYGNKALCAYAVTVKPSRRQLAAAAYQCVSAFKMLHCT